MTTFIISYDVKEPMEAQATSALKAAGWSEWYDDGPVAKELPARTLWQNNAAPHTRAVRAAVKAVIVQSGAELTKLIVFEGARWAGISDVERPAK